MNYIDLLTLICSISIVLNIAQFMGWVGKKNGNDEDN